MPLHTGLLRRGKSYFVRRKVPADLRKVLGKREIKYALKTSDKREAERRVKIELLKIDARFDAERQRVKQMTQAGPPLDTLGEAQIFQMVAEWFGEIERRSELDVSAMAKTLSPDEKRDVLDDWSWDIAVYTGGNEWLQAEDASGRLNRFLEKKGVRLSKDSDAYKRLELMFRKASLVNIRRNIKRLEGEPVIYQPLKFGNNAIAGGASFVPGCPPDGGKTLGELLDAFMAQKEAEAVTEGTLRTYQLPVRVLRELLGDSLPLSAITKQRMMELRDTLRKVPVNARQRFPGKPLEQVIREAENIPGIKCLDDKTAENYMNNMSAIFAYAVEAGMMTANPASGRLIKNTFKGQKKKARKAVFSMDELNALFRAPLYIDGTSKDKQSGRYWVPLLSLWHGLRCNEACQLYTEDFKDVGGVLCMLIRESVDDDSETEKKLKTAASERTIPVHPELMRLGFSVFLNSRRRMKGQPRLFPDLTRAATGYFSDNFQKWFSRFLIDTLGSKPKATFHSFRHMFRGALREADVSLGRAEALGGWKSQRSTEADYGQGVSMAELFKEIQKVKYPGLDLSHLYTGE